MFINAQMGRGACKAAVLYNNDISKLLTEAFCHNVAKTDDFAQVIELAERRVSNHVNGWMKMLISHPPGQVYSPPQHRWFVNKALELIAPLCTVTRRAESRAKPSYGLSVKEKRRQRHARQQERVIPFNPKKLRGLICVHCNSGKDHEHCLWSLIDSETGNVIVINCGRWKLALAYVRQELEIASGLNVPRLYKLEQCGKTGPCKVVEDEAVKIKLAEARAPKSKAEVELEKYQPPLKKTEAECYRDRIHPALLFRPLVNRHFPGGPPPPAPALPMRPRWSALPEVGKDAAVRAQLAKEDKWREELDKIHRGVKQVRQHLDGLLREHNMCIATGKHGGLVLCVGGETCKMSLADTRWTLATLETALELKGNWTLGLPKQEQKLEQGNVVTYETWCKQHAAPQKPATSYRVPWETAHVEIKQVNGQKLRKDAVIDENLFHDYHQLVFADKSVKNPAVSLKLRPILRSGELLMAIKQIPARELATFKARYQPALLMKIDVNNYTGVLVVHFDPAQRTAALNARAAVGHAICQQVGAKGWSDGFLAPCLQLVDGAWVYPELAAPPHKLFSAAAQLMMAPAAKELHANEIKWWIQVTSIEEAQRHLRPGMLANKLKFDAFETLRLCGPELTADERKTIETAVAKESYANEIEELFRRPARSTQQVPAWEPATVEVPVNPKPNRALDVEEEERRRRKREEEEKAKAARAQAEQEQAYGR
jgi:hypothetical protein